MIYILILLICYVLYKKTHFKDPKILSVYFGLPGAGKSTFAAYLAAQCNKESLLVRFARKHYDENDIFKKIVDTGKLGFVNLRMHTDVYSNVPILGAYEIDSRTDVGFNQFSNGKLIIDEAGIDYNNRSYKSMPKETIKWFKLHRHYKMSVDVFSQSFEDMDVTLRRLAYRYYLVKKSLIPNVICIRRIRRRIGINQDTHQIEDQYEFVMFGTKRIYAPSYYKYFDSYDAPELNPKEWHKYTAQQVDDYEDAAADTDDADPDEVFLGDIEISDLKQLVH